MEAVDRVIGSNCRFARHPPGMFPLSKPCNAKTKEDLSQLQDTLRLLSEARALPPLVFGTIINSSIVTFDSST